MNIAGTTLKAKQNREEWPYLNQRVRLDRVEYEKFVISVSSLFLFTS
jgi:hypothetical protein